MHLLILDECIFSFYVHRAFAPRQIPSVSNHIWAMKHSFTHTYTHTPLPRIVQSSFNANQPSWAAQRPPSSTSAGTPEVVSPAIAPMGRGGKDLPNHSHDLQPSCA
uniref:Uncharacterized protein n=1 Tax=Micrurus spixii TaxID=129469 RepID=A0A2D4M046_9SAUR